MLSVSAIEARYKRARLDTKSTFLWSNLSDLLKEQFKRQIAIKADEKFAICYHKSADYSWLITNERLIVLDKKDVMYLPYSIIQGVDFPGIDDLKANKKGIDTITFFLNDGASKKLFVESTTWHFIYGLLKILIVSGNQGDG